MAPKRTSMRGSKKKVAARRPSAKAMAGKRPKRFRVHAPTTMAGGGLIVADSNALNPYFNGG